MQGRNIESIVSNKHCKHLTLQGGLLTADGLMDTGSHCPHKLDDLRYTLSELPPTEHAEYQQLKDSI